MLEHIATVKRGKFIQTTLVNLQATVNFHRSTLIILLYVVKIRNIVRNSAIFSGPFITNHRALATTHNEVDVKFRWS